MNTKPILFSTEMVQAILADRKTQTRRTKGLETISKNGNSFIYDGLDESGDEGTENQHFFEIIDINQKPLEKYLSVKAPYQIGDILWVREKFRKLINCETGEFTNYSYYADMPENFHKQYPNKHKPSIHMPKEACRLFLKVTNVRVERLQDISEYDAICEGIELLESTNLYKDYEDRHNSLNHARISFASLWNSINSELTWKSNPWVWVIEFERIEKPENF